MSCTSVIVQEGAAIKMTGGAHLLLNNTEIRDCIATNEDGVDWAVRKSPNAHPSRPSHVPPRCSSLPPYSTSSS